MAYIDVSGLTGVSLLAGIDPVTRDLYLSANTVDQEVHPIDIYKEMRICRRLNEALRGYDVFLIAKGADQKTAKPTYTERYVVCQLGTRIIPYDISHQLIITGVIITDDGQEGRACFDRSPLTASTEVDIDYVPPQVEVIEVNTGGGVGTPTEVAAAVWNANAPSYNSALTFGHMLNYMHHVPKAVFYDPDFVGTGYGGSEYPFNDINDAIDHAEFEGITDLVIRGDITMTRNLKNLNIIGQGVPTIDLAGYDMKNTRFFQVAIEGAHTSNVIAQDCVLLNGLQLNGYYENCALMGDLVVANTANAFVKGCASGMPTGSPSISLNNAGTATLTLTDYSGQMTIKDCNQVTDVVSVEIARGSLVFDNSNTQGTMRAITSGKFTDNSNGATVIREDFVHDIHRAEYNKRVHDKVNNLVILYKSDNTTEHQRWQAPDDLSSLTPV